MRYIFGGGHGGGAAPNPGGGTPAPVVDPLKVLGVWVRPPDWPALPTIAPGAEKIVVSFAIFEESPRVGVTCFDSFHIDWGDGTTESLLEGGGTVTHAYNYNNPGLTPCSRGYKVAVATLTPAQDANLVLFEPWVGYYQGESESQILEMIISAPLLTSLKVTWTANYIAHHNFSRMSLLEHLDIRASGLSDISQLTVSCHRLGKVSVASSPSISSSWAAFAQCPLLVEVGDLVLTSGNSISNMFRDCYSLAYVPDLSGIQELSDLESGFKNCLSLSIVPNQIMSEGYGVSEMFAGCISLQVGPSISTPNAMVSEGIFSGCINLKSMGTFSAPNAWNLGRIFESCWSLDSAPVISSTSVTEAGNLFSQCYTLPVIPISVLDPRTGGNPEATVNCRSIVSYCFTATSVSFTAPATEMAGNDYLSGAFQNCVGLYSVSGITHLRGQWASSDGGDYTTFVGCGNLRLVSLPGSTDGVNLSNTFMSKQALLDLADSFATRPISPVVKVTLTGAVFADTDVDTAFSSRGYTVVR